MWRILLLITLAFGGCMPSPPPSRSDLTQADRLLALGLTEFLENRPTVALDSLTTSFPLTPQAELARQILNWKQMHPQLVPPLVARKTAIDTELREIKEENQRLRADIEKLRRLLIDSERGAR